MPFIRLVLFCADVVHDFMSQNGPYIAAAISFAASSSKRSKSKESCLRVTFALTDKKISPRDFRQQ